jgi:alpha-beta hydrolase superfamily lysophospholipase
MTLAKIINRIWPSFSLSSGLKVQHLSHNSRVVEEYKGDELVHGKISARTYIDMMRGADLAITNATKITIPILIMHGKKDYITSYEKSEILSIKIGKKATLKLWDNGFHELHNETFNQEVYEYLVNWIKSEIK